MPVQLQSSSGDEGDEARIEIIPLIDIMFFLLASFMLVSLSMTHLHRVPLALPEASTGIPDSKTPPFQISIDASGVTTWDRQIVTLSEITSKLLASAGPDESRVLISADAEARHKQVLGVLNAVRAAGITKVSFESKDPTR
ncbi:MAG: biopolymer transporter ExbD [Luteolibacter sp.]|uniref:ExbD/TolR family protein n=1 Tax=Luteolibacter sp. TaxID=1962973 RepID=UPI0032644F49